MAAILTVTIACSFASSGQSSTICIESIDGTPLNLNISAGQMQGMHSLLPEKYQRMLDASYDRFRTRTLSAGYDKEVLVDGFKCICTKTDSGDIYTISGYVEGLGYHTLTVKVDSRDSFIALADGLMMEK